MKTEIINRNKMPQWLVSCITPPKHFFWLPSPSQYNWCMTARLIYQNGILEFEANRCRLEGKSRYRFDIEIEKLKMALKENNFNNQIDDILHLRSEAQTLIASPEKSYGYLYLSIWERSYDPTSKSEAMDKA